MVRLFGRAEQRRHELLSAYVDGEVTAEEAREVEELLETSEEARRELAELQATVDLVRGLPELEPPRSFALDAAPEKRWTLWWPSVRATGLATSVAAMLLVALVAGEMVNVLEQARFGADESEAMQDSAFDDSAFAAAPAATEPALESAAVAAMDAPASPEPEAVLMKSAAVQEESPQVAAAPAAAAAAPRMAAALSGEEPATAMQQDTTEEATQSAETQSSEEPLVAAKQVAEDEAPQADEIESVETQLTEAQQKMEEEPLEAVRQFAAQDEQAPMEEVGEVDESESEGIALPLVELQVVTAIVAVVLVGATLVAVLRRRRSFLQREE